MSNRALLPQQMSTPANNMVPPPHTSLLVKGQTFSLFRNFPQLLHNFFYKQNRELHPARLNFVTCFEINAGECNHPYWVKASERPFLLSLRLRVENSLPREIIRSYLDENSVDDMSIDDEV